MSNADWAVRLVVYNNVIIIIIDSQKPSLRSGLLVTGVTKNISISVIIKISAIFTGCLTF